MKKTLLFVATIVVMQMKMYAQFTAVPNADFEQFLISFTSINGPLDGQILDSEAAAVIGTLNLGSTAPYNAVNDFTGIEALTGITGLVITYNSAVTSLDISSNSSLTILDTEGSISLSTIVTGANTTLSELRIPGSPVGSLDLTGNTGLTIIDVRQSSLTSLDMRNGNNANMVSFDARFNALLECIFVDDASAGYLTALPWDVDPASTFVNNEAECNTLSVTGVNELAFSVYPNPAKDRISVISNLQDSQIQVYDITGKLVLKKQIYYGENTLDISVMSSGVYLVKIFGNNTSLTKKLIIQ